MPVSEIAETLDINPSSVSKALETAYRALHHEDEAMVARKVDLERLDELHVAYFEDAKAGDIKAAELVLKTMDRRAKMLGLEAAIETKTDGHIQISWQTNPEPVVIEHDLEPINED